MKEIVPEPPPIVRNDTARIQGLFQQYVVPSYSRFDLALARGQGSYVWDAAGRRYLDLGGGIAVCSLGHAHPALTEALVEQSRRLVHVSNLYYHEAQGLLAGQLCGLIAPGRIFFCNSGAEADEGLFKLARKFGHDEGRFEILTMTNSFHGRTLAGISATGQEKVKKGFEPMTPGFRHVPYNDLASVEAAVSPATAAVLIEGVQGEGGVNPARPDYLLGLRRFCDQKRLLLLIDGVQCGNFRTGRFTSYQRILEGVPGGADFAPDGLAMAKSLGGGFPIGAFWVREPFADLLGPGTHGSTFGGTPLGCAVALKVLEVIRAERLDGRARETGDFLLAGLERMKAAHPRVIEAVRGLGLLIGIELAADLPSFAGSKKAPSIQFVERLHTAGVLTVPAGQKVIRLLPPLNLSRAEAAAGLEAIGAVVASLD